MDTADFALERLGPTDAARYKRVYRAIGERWFWFSRLGASDEEVSAVLADPGVEAFARRGPGGTSGCWRSICARRARRSSSIFGLAEEVTGRGSAGG